MQFIVIPFSLPAYIAVLIGLIVAIPLALIIFTFMPWMEKTEVVEDEVEQPYEADLGPDNKKNPMVEESVFFIHRLFGDGGEMNIWGGSYAGLAMYIGIILSVFLNAGHGGDRLGVLLMCQMITGALSIFIYYHEWKNNGWAYTFSSMLFTSAIVLTYPNVWQILVPTCLIGAIGCPYLIQKAAQRTRLGYQLPGLFFTQIGVGSLVIVWSFFILKIMMPALGL